MLCTASRTQVLGYRPLTTGRSKTHICINTGTCVFVQAGALKASRSLGPDRAAPWQPAQPSEKEELLLSRCEVVARTNATARERAGKYKSPTGRAPQAPYFLLQRFPFLDFHKGDGFSPPISRWALAATSSHVAGISFVV